MVNNPPSKAPVNIGNADDCSTNVLNAAIIGNDIAI